MKSIIFGVFLAIGVTFYADGYSIYEDATQDYGSYNNYDYYDPRYPTMEPPGGEADDCPIVDQGSRFLETIIRTEMVFFRMTPSRNVTNFFKRKMAKIRESVRTVFNMIDPELTKSREDPSHPTGWESTARRLKSSSYTHVLAAMANLQSIDKKVLVQSYQGLHRGIHSRDIQKILRMAIRTCQQMREMVCQDYDWNRYTNDTIRLVKRNGGPQPSEGRLEVRHEGRWGTVCDDGFSNVTAEVACKTLGFDTGIAQGRAPFGRGSGPIWLDDVQCNGTESSLFECRHNGWGKENCDHNEDIGLLCSYF